MKWKFWQSEVQEIKSSSPAPMQAVPLSINPPSSSNLEHAQARLQEIQAHLEQAKETGLSISAQKMAEFEDEAHTQRAIVRSAGLPEPDISFVKGS